MQAVCALHLAQTTGLTSVRNHKSTLFAPSLRWKAKYLSVDVKRRTASRWAANQPFDNRMNISSCDDRYVHILQYFPLS